MNDLFQTTEARKLSAHAESPAAIVIGLSVALLIGGLLATVLTWPTVRAGLVVLALGATGGIVVWHSLKLPVVPMLCGAFVASFWFRLEINLAPMLKQGHETPFGINVSLKLILSFLLFGAFILERWQAKDRSRVWPASFSLVHFLLWLFCLLSVVYSTERWLGLYALWSLGTLSLIGFITAAFFDSGARLRLMLRCTALAMLLNGALALLQHLEIFQGWALLGSALDERLMKIPGEEIARASGLMEASNSLGWGMATFCPLVIAPMLLAARSLSSRERLLCTAAFFASVVAMILSFSRGSWLASAVTLSLLALFALSALPSRERGRMLFKLVSVAALLLVMSIPFLGAMVTRLTGDDEGAAESRLTLMEVAVEMIRRNPLLGVGLSAYEAEMRRYDETADFITEHFPYPVHNLFLHVAAEAGIPALLCLLTLIAIALSCGWRAWRNRDPANELPRALAIGLLAGVPAFLLVAFKEPGSFDSGQMRPLFLLMGLLMATGKALTENPDIEMKRRKK